MQFNPCFEPSSVSSPHYEEDMCFVDVAISVHIQMLLHRRHQTRRQIPIVSLQNTFNLRDDLGWILQHYENCRRI